MGTRPASLTVIRSMVHGSFGRILALPKCYPRNRRATGETPALWLIAETRLPFGLIDQGRDGYTLVDVECLASRETLLAVEAFEVLQHSNGAFLSGGSGPLSLDCLFIQSPAELVPAGGVRRGLQLIDPGRGREHG